MNIQEMKARIKELGELERETFTKKYTLEKQLLEIERKSVLENKVLAKWAWVYVYGDGDHYTLKPYPNELYPEELHELLKDYHDSTHLTEHLVLGWSDGEVYLTGPAADLYLFIQEMGLRVDWSKLTNTINKLEKELAALKEIAAEFGVSND